MNINLVIALISKVRRDSSAYLEKELAAAGVEGVVASHGAILGALFRLGGKLKMKDIAQTVNRDKSTVTYLIKGLTGGGYVQKEKSGSDSRETYISLTPKALELENNIMAVSGKLIETAYQGFTEEEKVTLVTLLERMDQNFKDNL
jgi:DNA-binding MarR family transcriptional regulator